MAGSLGSVSPTPYVRRGATGSPRLTLGPPLWLRTSTATWLPHRPDLARGRLRIRAGGSAGGAKRKPPALVNRLPDEALRQLQPLHLVGSSLALGEALLGLQQPMHHQQLAHQIIEGLAGGPPVGIADRPSKERVGRAGSGQGAARRRRPPRRRGRRLAALPVAGRVDLIGKTAPGYGQNFWLPA